MDAPAHGDEQRERDADRAKERCGQRIAEARDQRPGDQQSGHVAVNREHAYSHDAAAKLRVGVAQQNGGHRHLAQALREAREHQEHDADRRILQARKHQQHQVPAETGGKRHARGKYGAAVSAQGDRAHQRPERRARDHVAESGLTRVIDLFRHVRQQPGQERERCHVKHEREAHQRQEQRRIPDVGEPCLEIAPRR